MTDQPPTNQPPQGPPPGQPYYVYPQPPKKSHALRNVLIAVGTFLVLVVGGVVGCTALVATSTPDDSGHSQVQPDNGGAPQAKGKVAKKPAAKPTHDPHKFGWWYDAKKDVAVNGIANADSGRHVTYTVTNQSDKTLDYDITFGLYDASGTRVGEAYGMPMSVGPGEHLVVTDPTEGYVDDAPGATTAKVLTVDAEQSDGS
jgi:hypothetical protein